MTAAEIAIALDSRPRREGRGWRTRCPCHGGFSLNVADARGGKLLVCCWAGCDPLDVLAEIRRLDLNDDDIDWSPAERPQGQWSKAAQHTEWARQGWERGRGGRFLKPYLRGRGITLDPPSSLRWLASAWHRPTGEFFPAMIARVENLDGELVAVHRTFLRADGAAKAPLPKDQVRMSLGPTKGGAIRLAQFDPDRALVVGEGIETVLSLMQLRGLPGWAVGSTGGLQHIELPPAAKRLLAAVDHDAHGAGERAARAAAETRWLAEGREVRFAMPHCLGDWNDVVQGKCDG